MKTYCLKSTQEIPIQLDEAWAFFSNPRNLKKITPDHMGFDIVTDPLPLRMYSGELIEYKVKPILGIPLRWITEIKNVEHEKYFIDEQRSGPYRFWYHEHWFESTEHGVIMKDKITYALPLGVFGRLANSVFVKKQLSGIFEHRRKKIIEIFG